MTNSLTQHSNTGRARGDGAKINFSVKMVRQAPLSMECSRQEYWSGLPFPTQGIFPTQGLNPRLLHLLYYRQILYPLRPPGKPLKIS